MFHASGSMPSAGGQARVWRPDWPCPVGQRPRASSATAAATRRTGSSATGTGAASARPTGPATLAIEPRCRRRATSTPRPGARAPTGRSSRCPALLGADDDWPGFEPRAPGARGGVAPPRALAARPQRPGDGGAGAGDHRAEGHRPGGVRRVPEAGAPVRRARARPGRRAQALGPAARRHAPAGPVVGVAADARRPGPLPRRSSPRPGSPTRLERTVGLPGDEVDRRLRTPPRHRGLDHRRGAPARARRPRRGVVRRLPRRQGRRLGRARHARSTTPSWRSSSSRGDRTAAGSPTLLAARRPAPPAPRPRMAPRTHLPGRGDPRAPGQSSGRSGARIISVNLRCRSRASHSPRVSSRQLRLVGAVDLLERPRRTPRRSPRR